MSTPLISVVIPSVSGADSLLECLAALHRQDSPVAAELIVVDRLGAELRRAVRERHPAVRVLEAEPRTSIPRLRALGVESARAPLVAFIEDHCIVDEAWLRVIARTHAEGHPVFGGVVENAAVERAVDWAAFFCEYSRFLAPLDRGETAEITGNNSVYARELLEQALADAGGELWESFLHARLRARGVPLFCEPELRVAHKKNFGFGYFVAQRYHYSRSFSAMRVRGWPAWRRFGYAAATTMLPALLLLRIGRDVIGKRSRRRELPRALPPLVAFLIVWAWGEAVGALAGAGRSLELVE